MVMAERRATVDVALLAKLGSLAVHIDELWSYQPPMSETADVLAIRTLLEDPEVIEWLNSMRPLGLLPIKRPVFDQQWEDARTLLGERQAGRLEKPFLRARSTAVPATDEYLKAVAEGRKPARTTLTEEEMGAIRQRRRRTGWANAFEHNIELRAPRTHDGDGCPICPGVVGGGHMPGCELGGWAE